ncbi:uncharacterized protein LOC122052234 isoform X2 [Zingiber officinale]|uniref:uncharacterized protein LOC122052234 isoform X2 n=1 Tax=Zingiber officinale TaxID=94328 RepID=UPI001C4D1307|nr:uncharacterized protein LOC122052234 isoform X2 [Zingiber officinale]
MPQGSRSHWCRSSHHRPSLPPPSPCRVASATQITKSRHPTTSIHRCLSWMPIAPPHHRILDQGGLSPLLITGSWIKQVHRPSSSLDLRSERSNVVSFHWSIVYPSRSPALVWVSIALSFSSLSPPNQLVVRRSGHRGECNDAELRSWIRDKRLDVGLVYHDRQIKTMRRTR